MNLDIRDLRDQLAILEQSLSDFKVAENYHDVEESAADIKSQLQKTRNSAALTDRVVGSAALCWHSGIVRNRVLADPKTDQEAGPDRVSRTACARNA